jgi:uncharacterized protein (DUF305 family)
MTTWLKGWGAAAPTDSMGHGGTDHGNMGNGMMGEADLRTLEQATGTAFDQKWVSMMIEHHEGAVEMARQVLATTQDPAVTELADAVVKAQTDEISKMKDLS